MDTLEQHISPLIEQQFPQTFREDGPILVAFMKAYFEWREEQYNDLWYARNLFNIKDIDFTLDEFLKHFKEKFLKFIPITSHTNVRNLVKHSLDLYRSKGTMRGVDLLFKLVFGQGATVIYPSESIFRLSDGIWKIPMYLEITVQDNNNLFVHQQIQGLQSGATAFVERVVRRTVGSRLIDVFYISAIKGNFRTGETIQDSLKMVNVRECPTIVGSLTSLNVSLDGSGTGFAVGDIVDVISSKTGLGGKARVTSVSDIVGIITFSFEDGGYGFSENAEVLISEKVFTITNVVPNTTPNGYFQLFETISQPKGSINYTGANGTFANQDAVFTYYANDSLKGYGRVYNVTPANSTAGQLEFFIMSGNLDSNSVFTTANAIGADLAVSNGYTDFTSTANIMGVSSNLVLTITSSVANFQVGETILGVNNTTNAITGEAVILTLTGINGPNAIITATNKHGVFLQNNNVYGLTSNNRALVFRVTYDLGVIDISSAFSNAPYNYIVGLDSGGMANLNLVSIGTGASFNVDTTSFLYSETVNLNSDVIHNYFHVGLEDNSYNFPALASANLTSGNVALCLSWSTQNVGTINKITNLNPGSGYNKAPMIRVYDPLSAGADAQDIDLTIQGPTGLFALGEVVEQGATGARGLVLSSNSSHLVLERLSVLNNFVPTVNGTTYVVGDDSGSQANVVYSDFVQWSDVSGFNLRILDFVQTEAGAISGIEVKDSGFGYQDGEVVILKNTSNADIVAEGLVNLGKGGKGLGYYTFRGGFLSDGKKLYDGYYYQEYSYDIQSGLALDKYKDMMVNVMHFAGSKMFGSLNVLSEIKSELTANSEEVSYV